MICDLKEKNNYWVYTVKKSVKYSTIHHNIWRNFPYLVFTVYMKIYIQKQYINQMPVLIINNNNKKNNQAAGKKARNAKMQKSTWVNLL